MPRIVSLLPAATEIVWALGAGHSLVGISHECDYPEQVRELPKLTRPRRRADDSGQWTGIDAEGLVSQGLGFYEVDAARLRELRPDVIITQTHCDICAATEADLAAALDEWLGTRPEIVSLDGRHLAAIWDDIVEVGAVLGRPDEAAALISRIETRMASIAARTEPVWEEPRVAVLEWMSPLMVAGNWVPDIVQRAGCRSVLTTAGAHSPPISIRTLVGIDPDVIVVAPCGYSLAQTLDEAPTLAAIDGWEELNAVWDARVFLTDGSQFFNRPGPRLAEAVEIIADIVHGAGRRGASRGKHWIRI